jgi:uncharacterized protein (TIGR02145 family)
MKNTRFLIYSFLIPGVLLVFAGCKKSDNNNESSNVNIPVLSTASVNYILQTTVVSGGNITSDGGATVTVRGVCWSTGLTPTVSNKKTTNGTGAGAFESNVRGLTPGTVYYLRAYATNSNGTGYGSAISFTTVGTTFTDSRDGNVYKIVQIANKIWMAENLRYLPSVAGRGTQSETIPYYYVYGYDGTDVNVAKGQSNYIIYGALYNWPAAINGEAGSTSNPSGVQGVSPAGWHLPSNAEWTELTDSLGGATIAGSKLKETGSTHWTSPNAGATNETGFTALPGGGLGFGEFVDMSNRGYWWSTTEYSSALASSIIMSYDNSTLSEVNTDKGLGISVRCVKD